MSARIAWTIEPLQSVGPVRFGMSVDAVRSAIDSPATPFLKEDSDRKTDAFDQLGVHVHFDADSTCEAVEFFDWAVVEPVLNHMKLLSLPYTELERCIREADATTKLLRSGLVSLEYGLGIYVDNPSIEDGSRAQSAIVCKAGYFDSAMQALETLARP